MTFFHTQAFFAPVLTQTLNFYAKTKKINELPPPLGKLKWIAILGICLPFWACKPTKEVAPRNEHLQSSAIQKAKTFFALQQQKLLSLKKQNSTLGRGTNSISESVEWITFYPAWDSTTTLQNQQGKTVLLTPVFRKVSVNYQSNLYYIRRLRTVLNQQGEVESSHIVELITTRNDIAEQKNTILANLQMEANPESGILVYDVAYNYVSKIVTISMCVNTIIDCNFGTVSFEPCNDGEPKTTYIPCSGSGGGNSGGGGGSGGGGVNVPPNEPPTPPIGGEPIEPLPISPCSKCQDDWGQDDPFQVFLHPALAKIYSKDSRLNNKQKSKLNKAFTEMYDKSYLFRTMISVLELGEPIKFYVDSGIQNFLGADGVYDPFDNRIIFASNEDITKKTLSEELFHATQHLVNPNLYSYPSANAEFEPKLFQDLLNENNRPPIFERFYVGDKFKGNKNYVDWLNDLTNKGKSFPQIIVQDDYIFFVNLFKSSYNGTAYANLPAINDMPPFTLLYLINLCNCKN